MELIWTAFILGLVGSLHCAGMCGPLALAVAAAPQTRGVPVTSRLVYNAGRTMTYCAIGCVFGLIGHSLVLAGLQRWLSIIAGLTILAALLFSSRLAARGPVQHLVAWVKARFAVLLRRQGMVSLFLLGMINGLLPCGLVYVAAAGAVAGGGFTAGILYMAAFGLGTWPLLLAISLAGQRFPPMLRWRLQKLVPISAAFIAVLLLLRGMGLGIPYLSPAISGGTSAEVSCH